MLKTAIKNPRVALSILLILLQRTPLLYKQIASQFSAPSIQILQKAIFTAAALGATHSLSGASASSYTVGKGNDITTYKLDNRGENEVSVYHNETGKIGELIELTISNTFSPASWQVAGAVPGLRVTDNFAELDVEAQDGYESIDTAVIKIIGSPSAQGAQHLAFIPFKDFGGEGESAPLALTISFIVEPADVTPPDPPLISYSIQEQTLNLSWSHDPQFPFTVERSNDLNAWSPAPNDPTILDETASLSFPKDENLFAFYRLILMPSSQ